MNPVARLAGLLPAGFPYAGAPPSTALSRTASPAFASARPGARLGPSPRRTGPVRPHGIARRLLARAGEPFGTVAGRAWLARLDASVAALGALSPAVREGALRRTAARSRAGGHDAGSELAAFAHACLAAERTLGLVPHPAQRLAARALLRGHFVEMRTGEGKTLATALAAAVGALDGTPVHVLTANDYLAERDAARLAPLYAALGLSGACVLPDMPDAERRSAYAADVVHATGKQVGFDRMRDALALGGARSDALSTRLGELARTAPASAGSPTALLRGLCLGLVDEADSLTIDEARVPLVLAAPSAPDAAARTDKEAALALGLARLLREGVDYRPVRGARRMRLTDEGVEALEGAGRRMPGAWRAARYRDERVRQALAALHLWHRDRDYVVSDGRVELVDAQTGRALKDRRLAHGLHGLLERKERCTPTPENETVASLPLQALFGGYVRLAGTSGTLREVRGEIARTYGARTVRVDPACPVRLRELPARAYAARSAQLDALVAEVRACTAAGRPVLVGTRTVEQSRAVSLLLDAHGIGHRTLSAAQDGEEADIVAGAGGAGRVTVATNMAGRGTDIPLGPGVAGAGGLHVVCLAFNDARRIDRQLAGRAARQGDPGSWRRLACLDDPALREALPTALLRLAAHALGGAPETRDRNPHAYESGDGPDFAPSGSPIALTSVRRPAKFPVSAGRRRACLAERWVLALVRAAQWRLERRHARERLAASRAGVRLMRHVEIGGVNQMD